MTHFKLIFISLFDLITFTAVYAQTPPAPFGLTPSAKQVEFFHREQTGFLHFNMNTFSNVEWGSGTEPESRFNPTSLDCNQWCRVLKKAGMTAAILTIKHHDGFCLWPSAYTDHCVKTSTWKSGKGDVVKEFTDACKANNIKACFYLSPWDMHESLAGAKHPFGTPAYVQYYCDQLVELLKNKPYGPVYEMWWDGAGSDKLTPADMSRWADTIHKYMPECLIWGAKNSASIGDIRWVGNESGVAGDPCWAIVSTSKLVDCNTSTAGNNITSGCITGNADDIYSPAETNTTIVAGFNWYYHPGTTPQSADALWNLYFTSVARNTVLLLDYPPDTRGLIPSDDSASGAGMGSYIYGTFRTNLLAGASAIALHVRGDKYKPENMLDSCESTYFASADAFKTDTIVFTPKSAITFDCIMLQEVIELGHRTLNWSVDAYSNNTWTTVSAANNKQCIGFKRAVKWSPATTATQVRLRITAGRACPAIHTFGVYKQMQVGPPDDWNGLGPVTPCSPTAALPFRKKTADVKSSKLQITGNRIILPADIIGPLELSIIDLKGRCVRRIKAPVNRIGRQVDFSSIKSGLYLVKCINGKKTFELKFTKDDSK